MRSVAIAMMLGAWIALPAVAAALDWAGIDPGTSTMEAVRARYGAPSKVLNQKVENYDTVQWTYEGSKAPPGTTRVVLEFGLLKDGAFKPDVVRDMRVEPKPGIFDRGMILAGWGEPDAVKVDEQTQKFSIFYYQRGLAVYFDREGVMATLMLFTPPQLPAPSPPAPQPPAPPKP
jgi:hypothetical protein